MKTTGPAFENNVPLGTERSRGLSERIVEAQEGERLRLSREVHDGLLQCVFGSRMLLKQVTDDLTDESLLFEQLMTIDECLKEATLEARRLLQDLRPAHMDDFELVGTVKLFLEKTQRETGILFDLKDETRSLCFSADIRNNFYRVVQEGVHNIVKHSRSDRALVTLGQSEKEAWVEILDWGRGLPTGRPAPEKDHIGLSSLTERATLLGGTIELGEGENGGVCLRVTAPLQTVLEEGFSNLRARAQRLLKKRPADLGEETLVANLGPDEVAALLHEFEVHRMELEVQNDELRLVRRELKTNRESYRELIKHSGLGYLELDSNGRITTANQTICRLIGCHDHELLARPLSSLLISGEWNDEGADVRLRRSAPPGWFWARIERRLVSESNHLLTIVDLTAEKAVKTLQSHLMILFEVAKRKETLATAQRVSHLQLRKILLQIADNDSEENVKSLCRGELSKAGEAMKNQARLESLQETFDFNIHLTRLLGALTYNIPEEVLTVSLAPPGDLVKGDPLLLGLVLDELLRDAEESIESNNGRIIVSTGSLSAGVEKFCYLDVAETGTGMGLGLEKSVTLPITESLDFSPEQPFRRLVQAKNLASQMNGRLSVRSGQGRGTTIRLVFPTPKD